MRIRDDEDDEAPEVNMAPLIDCIFLLLIFFLLTSTMQKQDEDKQKAVQQLALQLPESSASATASAQTEPLIIGIDASGRFYLGTNRVGVEELHRILRDAAAKKAKIRIEGDRNAAFDHIAHVIDLCEFEGLRDIAVRTRDK
jgi:biopolymer transport protein ExbD